MITMTATANTVNTATTTLYGTGISQRLRDQHVARQSMTTEYLHPVVQPSAREALLDSADDHRALGYDLREYIDEIADDIMTTERFLEPGDTFEFGEFYLFVYPLSEVKAAIADIRRTVLAR